MSVDKAYRKRVLVAKKRARRLPRLSVEQRARKHIDKIEMPDLNIKVREIDPYKHTKLTQKTDAVSQRTRLIHTRFQAKRVINPRHLLQSTYTYVFGFQLALT